jgi:hypothetical protein
VQAFIEELKYLDGNSWPVDNKGGKEAEEWNRVKIRVNFMCFLIRLIMVSSFSVGMIRDVGLG